MGSRLEQASKSKPNTRRKFPAKGADLRTRWCSSFLKIEPGAVTLRAMFNDRERVFFLTGERREESNNRAKYAEREVHRAHADSKRWITHWRPVIDWSEAEVWNIIERHSIAPHPAYRLGWGRLSCMTCIFGSANQWASVRAIAPGQFEEIAQMEEDFGHTIDAKRSVRELADRGQVYPMLNTMLGRVLAQTAMGTEFRPEWVSMHDNWKMPAGAFGESTGPS